MPNFCAYYCAGYGRIVRCGLSKNAALIVITFRCDDLTNILKSYVDSEAGCGYTYNDMK